MYPTPTSSIQHPPFPQQQQQQPLPPPPPSSSSSQFIPQATMNQNVHPPLPPTSASAAYPYPQHQYNTSSAASGHPGQPPLYPQPTSSAMGNNTANQQNSYLNGPAPVGISLLSCRTLACYSFLADQ